MQVKTIRKVLDKKLNDWVNSIRSIELQQLIKRDTIVTGGSIVSLLMGEKVNDYDIYFKTQETALAVAEYYVAEFAKKNPGYTETTVRISELKNLRGEIENVVDIYIPSVGVVASDDAPEPIGELDVVADGASEEAEVVDTGDKYRVMFMSSNAITLSHSIQLITRFTGDAEQVHKNFDFVHAQCWFDWKEDKLFTPEKSLLSMMSKTLKYTGSLYPLASLFRLKKFLQRGWRVSAGEMLKIAFQIKDIDFNDPLVLRQQLTGVDLAYFHMLIRAIEEFKKANPDKDLTSSYIVELIDRIFGG